MKVGGIPYRTIWREKDLSVGIIDQTRLPHEFVTVSLRTLDDAVRAIRTMQVRGAPLIGVAAAYGVALAMRKDPWDGTLDAACEALRATRPTAVNLAWGLAEMRKTLAQVAPSGRADAAFARAAQLADEDVENCRRIAQAGLPLLQKKSGRVNVLTHCNAGWLATVDWGTALAPVFAAHDAGVDVHVWVDETRPRSQGYLTAWELAQQGIPHTLVVDNVGGHLMQHGHVDLCIVGTDRTTRRGDVCNKIGTYLKALAAHDNGVPFYAAVPHSSIDFRLDDGVRDIPIEERDASEVHEVTGLTKDGRLERVRITPQGENTANFGFDVTPARLMTGLITDRGLTAPGDLLKLFPEHA